MKYRDHLLSIVMLALPLGACVAEEEHDSLEPRISVSAVGGHAVPWGDDDNLPDLPSDQCAGHVQGTGEWCDCMGAAIDEMTDLYAACEDVLDGEGPTDITRYQWCSSLQSDFDSWWDAC